MSVSLVLGAAVVRCLTPVETDSSCALGIGPRSVVTTVTKIRVNSSAHCRPTYIYINFDSASWVHYLPVQN